MTCGSLKCSATNCAYNEELVCKAGHIHVSGYQAKSMEGTYCASFVDKVNGSLTNSLGNLITSTCNIECEAHNCKYNNHKVCYADSVKISEDNECCYTFDCKDNI